MKYQSTFSALVYDIGEFETKIGSTGQISPSKVYKTENGVIKNSLISNSHGFCANFSEITQTIVVFSTFETNSAKKDVLDELFSKLPGIFIISSAVAVLFSYGVPSGLVVEYNEGSVNVVPVIDGIALKNSSATHNFGGKKLSEFVLANLQTLPPAEVHDLKAFLSNNGDNSQYMYDHDKSIETGSLATSLSEKIFSMDGTELVSLVRKVVDDSPNKEILLQNIALSGGTTEYSGFKSTLQDKLTAIYDKVRFLETQVSVHGSLRAFVGASIVGSTWNVQNLFISSADYNNEGYEFVESKRAFL